MSQKALIAIGAVFAALSVALAAYAAHMTGDIARTNVQTAAIFGFGHGVAVAALAQRINGRLQWVALVGLLLGALLFGVALVAKSIFNVPLGMAPWGGSAMILSWLLYALTALKKE